MSMFQDPQQQLLPLALRMAPKTLEEYQGQEHLVASGAPIYTMIQKKCIQSMIFFGPPATGKTGLARIIARILDAEFILVNALSLNSDDIKQIHKQALHNRSLGRKTILFIDEIHRLTRPKQDVFLDSLESGLIILLGATTENPYFALQPALRSRLLIFEFFPLNDLQRGHILARALVEDSLLVDLGISLEPEAEQFLIQYSSDPRNMLIILETAVLAKSIGSYIVSKNDLESVIQKTDTLYDGQSAHYDTISAFIKSIRGSDPDAALYYLAVMIESGEDPRFIFRRLLILAVEDIGLASPDAVSVVLSCADAFERIGYPEGSLHLSHAVLFLAGLPKSNSVLAIHDAIAYVRQGNILSIPNSLRDSHYQGASDLNCGKDYLYPHDFPDHFTPQQYTSHPVSFYNPQNQGFERKIKERLSKLWPDRYH